MSENTLLFILLLLGAAIFCVIYMVPSIVAFRRNHPNRWVIFVINLAFGGTVIGWGFALVWAMRAVHRPSNEADGGESGLNIFINDPKTVRLATDGHGQDLSK